MSEMPLVMARWRMSETATRAGCDFCAQNGVKVPAEYDAKTVFGAWAYLCQTHWQMFAAFPVLGPGKGQRLTWTTVTGAGEVTDESA